jgi:hypothetical protein
MKFNKHSNCKFIPKHAFRALIVGKSQSGKTYLATELLTQKKYYQHFYDFIIIFTPNADQAHYKKIKRANKKTHQEVTTHNWDKRGKEFLHDFIEFMGEIRAERVSEAEDGDDDLTDMPNALVFFDDIGKSDVYRSKEFATLIDVGRHRNISTMFIAHTYEDVPKTFRKSFTDYFFFDMGSKSIKDFYETQATMLMQPRHFSAFCEYVFRDRYKFLYVRTNEHVKHGRYRDGFDNPLYVTGKYKFCTHDCSFDESKAPK